METITHTTHTNTTNTTNTISHSHSHSHSHSQTNKTKEIISMNTNTNTNTINLLSSYTPGQIEFIKFLQQNRNALTVYDTCTVNRKDLVELIQKSKYIAVPAWIAASPIRRAGRGNYMIPEIGVDVSTLTVNTNKRGRKPGSPNQKGRVTPAVPSPAPANTVSVPVKTSL